jgi:hypothetical protein
VPPQSLALELSGHEVHTATQAGWSSVKNGELLRLEQVRRLITTTNGLKKAANSLIALTMLVARTTWIESFDACTEFSSLASSMVDSVCWGLTRRLA